MSWKELGGSSAAAAHSRAGPVERPLLSLTGKQPSSAHQLIGQPAPALPGPPPLAQKLIAERGGNPWDTVKPLQRYFADLSRVLLVDDSPHKSLPNEAANMLVMPRSVAHAGRKKDSRE